MSYYYDFGRFHESVTVDGQTYTFEDFRQVSSAKDRAALKESAVGRCVAANVARRQDPNRQVVGNTYPAAVEDVFHVWERRVESPWDRLNRLLSHFDWYYEYSDDHRVWTAGKKRADEVTALVRELGPDAQALFNQKCPWLNDDGTRKGAVK